MLKKKKSDSFVVISYVPLLTDGTSQVINPADAKKWAKKIDENDVHITACAWVEEQGQLCPVLALENMNQVIDHLEYWAEGVPQRWFDFHICKLTDRYVVALMPNLIRSRERYAQALKLTRGIDVPSDADIMIIFKPLQFISTTLTKMFKEVEKRIEGSINVYFIEESNLEGFDLKNTRCLGKFKILKNKMTSYFEQQIENEEKPKPVDTKYIKVQRKTK